MAPALAAEERAEALTLLASVFLVAACGLIYELLIATISSYLLGSSVTQFSLCIGTFIGAMGVGSYVSQFVQTGLLRWFLTVEVVLALVGGVSAGTLYAAYATLSGGYYVVLFGLLIVIGALVGLELPLLTRLLARYGAWKDIIAHALSFDYVGSLLGSIAFPLVLLPTLGTARTAFVIGLLNIGVAFYNIHFFRRRLQAPGLAAGLCGLVALGLAGGLAGAEATAGFFERRLYEDQVIYTKQTPYQRIVLTRYKRDLRLYLDGNLQFSAADEYRYHEALVHPAMALAANREDVLVLGGGDGLGVREILKWPGVKRVTLVDIDPAMTRLARTYPALVALNGRALDDPRVRVVHEDAFTFLARGEERFGVIVGDLPDPNNEALAKLFSREFFRMARRRLGRGGLFVTQATSPLFSRDAFWCAEKTLREAGWAPTPYHVYVPSFGDWGFLLAREGKTPPPLKRLPLSGIATRFLTDASAAALTAFDADTGPTTVQASTLDHPRILNYYDKEARKWE